MSGKTITVTIDKVGRPTVEANGFVGTGCKAATAALEAAFAGGQMDVTEKPEMYMEPVEQQEYLTN